MEEQKMKTIQIAPYKKDVRIIDNMIIAKMRNLKIILCLPEKVEMPKDKKSHSIMKDNLIEAIALCSKTWQIEELLDKHWQIKGCKISVTNIYK